VANPEHVSLLKQTHLTFATWRKANPQISLELSESDFQFSDFRTRDLRKANLSRSNLNEAILVAATLSGANLANSCLSHSLLIDANLSGANLTGANLDGANLYRADLRYADLRDSSIRATNFNGANLDGANFQGALLRDTIFANVDLSSTIGLEDAQIKGPAEISVSTLYASRGQIPAEFLRDCGVPDAFIAYLPSLIGAMEPIQFYSCFISYSHKDEKFCERLFSRMRHEKLRVWYAPEDMKSGQKIHEQIDQAIRVHDKLLLVLSDKSMNSEWVATEIYHARQREVKEGRRVLFPIRIVPFEKIQEWRQFDADTGKDMAREIREYFIPDFSNWKDHDSFEAAFKRLMDDLRAAETKKVN
jgi:hypothetical protein